MRPPYANATHQTIGSDVLAVLHTLRSPAKVLGDAWLARLSALEPGGWYSIDVLLDLLYELERKGGHAALVHMGRQLFKESHQKRVGPLFQSAGDVVFGIDAMYHHANRGQDIGGWQVVRFEPGRAVLHKTTPHHCALEEGILYEALHSVRADSRITQGVCRQEHGAFCEFVLQSAVKDERWMGRHAAR